MIATINRAARMVVVLVILGTVVYGWDAFGRPGYKPPGRGDTITCDDDPTDCRDIALEIEGFVAEDSFRADLWANLGSAGRHERDNTRIWDGEKHPERQWRHKFRARRGERVNAAVQSKSGPIRELNCYFYQKGFKTGDPDDPAQRLTVQNSEGWGDISMGEFETRDLRERTTCNATVQ
jgi:hypothetical protein